MLPDPMHPAIVHFPVALAGLVPFFAALILLAIRSSHTPKLTWVVVVLMQAMLVGSAWFAGETGHDEEERVEKVVKESYIEAHEEAADLVFWIAAAGLAAALVGLAEGNLGAWGRAGALVISLAALAASVQAGRLGGELVYHHGAANAYIDQPPSAPPAEAHAH